MLNKLLPKKMYESIQNATDLENITELRVRKNKRLICYIKNKKYLINDLTTGKPYICSDFDVQYIVDTCSGHSVYAVTEQIIKGYLFFDGGIRIGVCGQGVYFEDKLTAVKDISYLTIRIPHQVLGCADKLLSIINNGGFHNTLILSPPGAGKTTMLREITRQVSNQGTNVLLIDERCELAGVYNGKPTLDVGDNTDILTNVNKNTAYQNVIRSMNPDLIVTDELYSNTEIDSLIEASYSGVNICASIHSKNIDSFKQLDKFKKLFSIFDYFVTLSKENIGQILSVVEKKDFTNV